MRRSTLFAMALAITLAGCDVQSLVAPDESNQQRSALSEAEAVDPAFLRFSTDQVIKDSVATFWAVKGENREVILRFEEDDESGGSDDDEGDKFLRFKVPNDALHLRPDGTPFLEGDSVEITIRVDPTGRFIFHFEPVGLVFNPDVPAELKIWYDEADPDLNGDGVVDDDDVATELELRLFRQQDGSTIWEDIGFVEFDPLDDEIEGDVHHFTGFALAS